jgi:hypothetical protein
MSACLAVRRHGTIRLPLEGFSWNKFNDFSKICRKNQVLLVWQECRVTLHEDLCTFMISPSVFLIIGSVSEKSCRENQNKHFTFNNFLRNSRRLWEKVEKICTTGEAPDDNIKRRTRCSGWITKATNTHSECVIFIAFPLQQWLRERDSMLRYIDIAYLVRSVINIALTFLYSFVRCLSDLFYILCCLYQLFS